MGFEDAGDFTVTERLKTSIRANLVFYLIVGSIGLFGLVLLILMKKIRSGSNVLGVAMACSNTFGLVTGAFLLGFGLSEIPKSLWKNADWTTRQKVLTHKIAKMAVKLDDAHQELSNAIVVAQATSNQMSKRDPLRPYMNVIDNMLSQMFREDPSFKPQGGRLGENDMDYDTDEKSMATLRRHLRGAREGYCRYKSEYMTFVLEALELEDTIKNYEHGSSTRWKYISSFRPAQTGKLGAFFDRMEFFWRCILRKQFEKLLAIILGTMSAAILLAEATLLPSRVKLSLFSILIKSMGKQELFVQVWALIPLMYMCICTYYSLFKIGMLMFYSLTPRQTSSVSLLMICSMVARYAPPISYNFLNLISLDAKTIFETRMGDVLYILGCLQQSSHTKPKQKHLENPSLASMSLPHLSLQTFLILLVVGNGQGLRGIRLSSEEPVSARVVDHLDLNSSTPSSNTLNSTKHACSHPYGFLPCASNIPGYIFQIIVLEYLLLVGDKILTKGRQQLFSILGVGIYGATVFRILAVLPTIVLLLASGLAQNKEAAQARIENGVGTLTGSTVFYLTLQWGICVLVGRTKITKESSPLPQQESSKASTPAGCLRVKRRLSILKEYGVETDKQTRHTAGIMLMSLIPFMFVEIASNFKSQPWSLIVTLTVSVAALVSYFVFQSRHQWIQERSLEYSRDQLLLAGFLDHLHKFAKKTLVNDEGHVDGSCIKRAFRTIDADRDDYISKAELREFLAKMNSEHHLDENFAIEELMKHFDQDSNHLITVDEFRVGCERYVQNAKKLVADKTDSSKKYFPDIHRMFKPWINRSKKKLLETEEHLSKVLNTTNNEQLACLFTDGKPDVDKIRSLFVEFDKDGDKKLTLKELKELIVSKFKSEHGDLGEKIMKVFDKDKDRVLQEEEFLDGFKKRLCDGTTTSQFFNECIQKEKSSISKMSKSSLIKAVIRVGVGIAIVSSLGIPLVNNTQLLSERLGIPPFFISFVVLPFAVNFKTAMATIYPASQKKERASSIMFSEIYGAVFMNNILGLLTLVGLIWARGFSWDFSSEVLVLMVVSAIIGVMGYRQLKYPFWSCILAFSFYPLSLVFFYVIRVLAGWK